MRFAPALAVLRFLLVSLALLATSACEFVMSYIEKSPEERLVETVRDEWTAPGGTFVDGAYGSDTISSVEAMGRRGWRVTIPARDALGGARTWELEIEQVEVLPVFSGQAFARFLTEEAIELDRRTTLTQDAWSLLADGGIMAVGVVSARVRRADRSGTAGVERVAFLRPTGEDESEWTLESDTRTTLSLVDVLRLVYDEMIRRDDRVLTCMASANPTEVPRRDQLACVEEVLKQQFGEDL